VALQIANPQVVEKIHALARQLGISKTAAVDRAVDCLLLASGDFDQRKAQMYALLRQFDQVPKQTNEAMRIQWDDNGLPT